MVVPDFLDLPHFFSLLLDIKIDFSKSKISINNYVCILTYTTYSPQNISRHDSQSRYPWMRDGKAD